MASSKQVATATPVKASTGLMARTAARFGVDPDKMKATLAATVFKGANDEQLMALLIVAEKYNLNPWLKEIYAFPAKGGGIVPIVGVDGWIKLINSSKELQSISFAYGPEQEDGILQWIECTIELSNRTKPITIREYFRECYRDTDPWNNTGNRMLRHRALIQCGRVALGYVGIYEPDEGERFAEAIDVTPRAAMKPITQEPKRREPDLALSDEPTKPIDDVPANVG